MEETTDIKAQDSMTKQTATIITIYDETAL